MYMFRLTWSLMEFVYTIAMKIPSHKPKIGVSACLLGENVRYDGGHFRDKWVSNHLAPHVDFHPVCPEMMMGLGSPREILRVIVDNDSGETSLIETKSKIDHTQSINEASKKILSSMPELDGFILARKSPSCGVITAKHYNSKTGYADGKGAGLFAAQVLDSNFNFPTIDSGLLFETEYKDLFVKQVYAHFELRKLEAKTSEIQRFHSEYKYLLMEHHPALVKELGKLASKSDDEEKQKQDYMKTFMETIKNHRPTKKKRVNVYQHLLGYFKKDLSAKEKENLLEKMEAYRQHKISYQTLLEVMDFLIDGHLDDRAKVYLKHQKLFKPYPEDLSPYKF